MNKVWLCEVCTTVVLKLRTLVPHSSSPLKPKTGLSGPPLRGDDLWCLGGVSGVLTWTVDGRTIDVGPGQALYIPRGAIHLFANKGSTTTAANDVKVLCVITPAAL